MPRSDWIVGETLGQGSAGVVVAVEHAQWGHRAALKSFPFAEPTFLREVQAIAAVDHPHVVRIYDQGTEDGDPWMVMERAEGSLRAATGWAELKRWLSELLQGLAAAHATGVLHLDVKPSNVLTRADGSVVLADFGVAGTTGNVHGGGFGGSLPYMAPERFTSAPLDRATDLYSVGIVAWELACGSPPRVPTHWSQAADWVERPLPPMVPRIPVPAGFEGWVRSLLVDRPYRGAAGALARLTALHGETVVVSPAQLANFPTSATVPADQQPPPGATTVREDSTALPPIPSRWPRPARPRRLSSIGEGLVDWLAVPFVGREEERAVLWDALLDPETRVVVLRGPRGVGKSRLGQAFCIAADQYAGAHIVRTAGTSLPQRAVVWLDDADAAALALLSDAPRGTTVVLVATEPVDGAEELWVHPLPVSDVRQLLAGWMGLDPELVTRIADRCGSDLSLALQLVREAAPALRPTPKGFRHEGPLELPTPVVELPLTDGILLAAAVGDLVPARCIDPETKATLVEHRVASLAPKGTRWVSRSMRLATLQRYPQARRSEAHREAASRLQDRWERGQQLLLAGDLAAASEDLYIGSAMAIAQGQMATAQRVVALAFQQLDPTDHLTSARMHRVRALIGPTHRSYQGTYDDNRRAVRLCFPHRFEPGWEHVYRSSASGLLWLANVRYLPRDGMEALEFASEHSLSANGLLTQAEHVMLTGDLTWAAALHQEAYERAKNEGDTHCLAVSSFDRWLPMAMWSHPEALRALAASKAIILDEYGIESARADVERSLGDALRLAGQLDVAEAHYDAAFTAMAQGEARADEAARMGLALLRREQGDLAEAERLLRLSQAQLRDEGYAWEAMLELHLASVRGESGESAAAALRTAKLVTPDLVRSAQICGVRLAAELR